MPGQRWSSGESRRIEKRIVVEGTLRLKSPAHFGTGDERGQGEVELLVDASDGRSPMLPGTSLAGALRNYLMRRELGPNPDFVAQKNSQTSLLFGGLKGDDEGEQSCLIIDDAISEQAHLSLRDGVALDARSHTAAEDKLFSHHMWSAGTTFPLRFELVICWQRSASHQYLEEAEQIDYEYQLRQALATALHGLTSGDICVGARTRRGFGGAEVIEWRLAEYDMRDPAQLYAWIATGDEPLGPEFQVTDLTSALEVKSLIADRRHLCTLQATFSLPTSLLIRAGAGTSDIGPDMEHLGAFIVDDPEQQRRPIISGTSLAGALRTRAYMIAELLKTAEDATYLNADLFGEVDELSNRAAASRLYASEAIVENTTNERVQNRVSIDRFTGGAREGALFSQQPTYGTGDTQATLTIQISEPQDHEIGLLLLLLKDLWNDDLPLGGERSVGRGRLRGRYACLELPYQSATYEIWSAENEGLVFQPEGSIKILQEQYVDAFLRWEAPRHGDS